MADGAVPAAAANEGMVTKAVHGRPTEGANLVAPEDRDPQSSLDTNAVKGFVDFQLPGRGRRREPSTSTRNCFQRQMSWQRARGLEVPGQVVDEGRIDLSTQVLLATQEIQLADRQVADKQSELAAETQIAADHLPDPNCRKPGPVAGTN